MSAVEPELLWQSEGGRGGDGWPSARRARTSSFLVCSLSPRTVLPSGDFLSRQCHHLEAGSVPGAMTPVPGVGEGSLWEGLCGRGTLGLRRRRSSARLQGSSEASGLGGHQEQDPGEHLGQTHVAGIRVCHGRTASSNDLRPSPEPWYLRM